MPSSQREYVQRKLQERVARAREERWTMNLIAVLKDITDTSRLHLDEMVVLSAQGKMLRAEFQNHEMEVPVWLTDALQLLSGAITTQNRDNMLLKLRQLEQEEGALLSRDEKRAKLAAQRERLQAQLGIKPAEAQAAGGAVPAPAGVTN